MIQKYILCILVFFFSGWIHQEIWFGWCYVLVFGLWWFQWTLLQNWTIPPPECVEQKATYRVRWCHHGAKQPRLSWLLGAIGFPNVQMETPKIYLVQVHHEEEWDCLLFAERDQLGRPMKRDKRTCLCEKDEKGCVIPSLELFLSSLKKRHDCWNCWSFHSAILATTFSGSFLRVLQRETSHDSPLYLSVGQQWIPFLFQNEVSAILRNCFGPFLLVKGCFVFPISGPFCSPFFFVQKCLWHSFSPKNVVYFLVSMHFETPHDKAARILQFLSDSIFIPNVKAFQLGQSRW